MSAQTVTLCDDSSGQLQIKISDEPDQSGFETVNPKYGVETGYKKTSQMIDRALASLKSIHIHRSGDVYLKCVVIDGRIVWYGSIDVLGPINRQDSFIRLVSGNIAMMLTDK